MTLVLTHPLGHGGLVKLREEAKWNHQALINDLLVKQTKPSTDFRNEFQTALVKNASYREAQMKVKSNSLWEGMRALLSQNTTADSQTFANISFIPGLSANHSDCITSYTLPISSHAQTDSSASITSNKTIQGSKIDKLLDTVNFRQFRHWCKKWNTSSGPQNFASFHREQQIWNFFGDQGTHRNNYLENCIEKYWFTLKDIADEVKLCHHFDDPHIIELSPSVGQKSRLKDPPPRSPAHRFKKFRQSHDSDHLVDLISHIARFATTATRTDVKLPCGVAPKSVLCMWRTRQNSSQGRDQLNNSDSAYLISTQNPERLVLNINTGKKPQIQLTSVNNPSIDIIGER
ncbi:unnamed protein product [Lepeophtheirus salmonis]|uniref:(salmon louse) hypothetical protein n=1 Tax=Lepeophtheirus salmonis TaxID=72036 RepID=A0A7R8CKU4_LEPSM|nr:unnamed protein product [Lepeophtheirus salmonis]CAF2851890.1 unnamed protein product [Lepeophtheirus salmonis]